MHNLGKSHWNVIKYILAYIKGILNYGITYRVDNKLDPTGYMDSDFIGCKDICHSTKGNICCGRRVSIIGK